MIVVGVVGGIASGKSLVTGGLQELGAVVLDADRVGHQVLMDDDVKAEIRDHWGNCVFDPNGQVIRQELGKIVFAPGHQNELRRLEEITHPKIEQQLKLQIQKIAQDSNVKMIVLDAPIMIKAGWHKLCDQILFVDATWELRLQRALLRGWTEETLANREASQTKIEEKRRLSTYVIENNGSIAETVEQVRQFWNVVTKVLN